MRRLFLILFVIVYGLNLYLISIPNLSIYFNNKEVNVSKVNEIMIYYHLKSLEYDTNFNIHSFSYTYDYGATDFSISCDKNGSHNWKINSELIVYDNQNESKYKVERDHNTFIFLNKILFNIDESIWEK
ncbi:MAG: hypothetical protein IJO78_07295 [Erysipelotrichaceae bacterium]|nr:hypothetical protein [Erysipelotrichaceae bacterium]